MNSKKKNAQQLKKELEPKHKISLENNENFINYDENKVYSEYIESNYSKNFGDIKNWFTVSDDKLVSMPIERVPLTIKVVSKTDEKDEMKAVSKIEEKAVTRIKIVESYNGKVFLSNGKLFIYDENLGSITKWDINTSKFEAYFLFDNGFSVDNMKLSDNGVLLFVYGKKLEDNLHEDPYPCISIYSADRGIRFTTFYLIASETGARLLIVYHKSYNKAGNYRCSLCNPFAPYIPFKSYVKAYDLFKDFDVGGTLIIKHLIKDLNKDSEPNYNDWIFYLRNKLEDFNSIFISSISEQIIDLIVKSKQTAKEATFDIDKKYSKYFVTWTLKYEQLYKNMHIFLTAEFKNDKIESAEIKSDTIQIVPAIYITSDRDVKKFVKELSLTDDRLFFRELIEKHINNKFFLILYGQKLVQDIIEEDEETLLRKLFNGCIKQIEEDEETLNSLIFNIFSQSITKIFKQNPSFFDDFITQISLLCVLK
ncbi:13704_t:CDS:2, partial [Gigaspora rosea]